MSPVERAAGIDRTDILCDVMNGAKRSTPSGRLTDHLAIGVLTGLIHRDFVDDVIRECGKREKRSIRRPSPPNSRRSSTESWRKVAALPTSSSVRKVGCSPTIQDGAVAPAVQSRSGGETK